MKEHIEVEEQEFVLEKNETKWMLHLKRSQIASGNLAELKVLEMSHPLLLPQKTSWNDEEVTFTYDIPQLELTFEDLNKRLLSEKLRVALNIIELEACLSLPITFFLAPEMIFLTKDGVAQLAYRGLREVMAPKQQGNVEFLRQLKCVLVTVLEGESFHELYRGKLETAVLPDFLQELVAATDIEAIRELLVTHYCQVKENEEITLKTVSKRSSLIFKQLAVWMSVIVVILAIPLVYLVFFRGPFTDTLLEADTAFLKKDYTEVVTQLKNISIDALPYTQKYELATAVVQSQDLADDKKENILNNVSLKTDELYLNYWIELGRGDLDTAVDTAKRLEETELIIYGLLQQIAAVRDNDNLTGAEREEQLSALEEEYQTYADELQATLEGTETSGNSTSDSSSDK